MDSAQKHAAVLALIIVTAFVLRFTYCIATPPATRNPDFEGHRGYILYVADYWSIPSAQLGWQTYQPPLYYFATALIVAPFRHSGTPVPALMKYAQYFSLLLSLVTYLVSVWIGGMLFPETSDRTSLYLFCGVMAVFPSLIYVGTRVSNDALLQLLSFTFFAFLYRWWLRGTQRDWILACIILTAGLLTKSSAIPLVPLAFICILLRKETSNRRKATLGAILVCTVLAGSGWYYVVRFGIEGERRLVGNLHQDTMNRLYIPDQSITSYLVVRPHELLKTPYIDHREDVEGRRYFWDSFLLSSIATESKTGKSVHNTTRGLLLLLFLFIPLGAWGLVRDLWKNARAQVPLWATPLLLAGASIANTASTNLAGTAVFRFVTLMSVPGTYYVLQGIRSCPGKLQQALVGLMVLFIVLCIAFFVLL